MQLSMDTSCRSPGSGPGDAKVRYWPSCSNHADHLLAEAALVEPTAETRPVGRRQLTLDWSPMQDVRVCVRVRVRVRVRLAALEHLPGAAGSPSSPQS